jgi:integrase
MPRDHKRTQETTSKNSQVLVKALINLNQRLRSARLRVRVEVMNEALYLRGVIPGSGGEWRQRRIPLGLKFAGGNLIAAEVKAKDLAGDLAAAAAGMGSFPLAKWGLLLSTPEDSETVGFWADRLIAQAAAEGLAPSSIKDYRRALGRLDRSAALSNELLLAAMADPWLVEHPRTQLLCCQKFGQLARLAGLSVDLSRHRGGYSPASLTERVIPDRDRVFEVWRSIPHPGWRWVLGAIVVFGLRNHEVFYLDLANLMDGGYSAFVVEGKTGPHTAWAMSPEDVDRFELRSAPCLPRVTFASHDQAGARVSKYLSRERLGGFTPYDLRHLWAIETGIGPNALPLPLAAKAQGHSQRVHETTYQRWTSPEIQRGAYESAHGLRG